MLHNVKTLPTNALCTSEISHDTHAKRLHLVRTTRKLLKLSPVDELYFYLYAASSFPCDNHICMYCNPQRASRGLKNLVVCQCLSVYIYSRSTGFQHKNDTVSAQEMSDFAKTTTFKSEKLALSQTTLHGSTL